jgi:hypothetical protein
VDPEEHADDSVVGAVLHPVRDTTRHDVYPSSPPVPP